MVDVSIGSSQDILQDFAISSWGMALFVVIAAISIFAQLYIIEMIGAKIKQRESGKRYHFGRFKNVARLVQYALSAIMISIILQMVFTSQYYTNLLTAALAISYGFAIYLSSVLAYKFFSWFRINRSLIVLLYGIASVLIVANAVDTIVLFDNILLNKSIMTSGKSEVIYEGNYEPDQPMYATSLVMNITQTGYFLLIWSATVLLLYHNIKRVGKARFWSLVIPPILFFMSFYITFYETILPPNPEEQSPPLVYILLVIYSMVTAGIFFGIGFLSIGKSGKLRGHIRDYMSITGYAFILFILSSISVIGQAGYPPYGLASVNTVGIASFLMLVGLYNSAITVSQDVQLRRSIMTSAKEESKLLGNIGSAEMQNEIEKRVVAAMRRSANALTEESGIEPSMNEQEIIDYLNQTAEERRGKKQGSATK